VVTRQPKAQAAGPPRLPEVSEREAMVKIEDTRDEELVRRAQDGDADAFGELVERYRSKMYRLARPMTKTDEDAEDVIQESFFKAYRSLSRFRRESKFSTWLYRITVNHALMKLRRKEIDSIPLDTPERDGKHAASTSIHDTAPDPLARLVKVESRKTLDNAIAGLPTRDRTVLTLRYIEELSTNETGRMLDLSTSAIKSRLFRARSALRAELLRHDDARVSKRQPESLCSVA
jgi:RNA polymerase sigma-70 factor (ECF subfamily)